ncbi:hypothetical protein [Mesorhizobium sp. STM 4661]|uniref:hypothetical protein n=1 Tax=Mesorhizobium sp. STM 4661 TaxID=1297570 RepID=UPI0002BD3526|nr:hypothetical protein [Mesorhizobium sp. STM 4661]CCV12676.1 hypothetical protein MESS4_460040 [Mesorhizobium sp. STM 4661]
MISGRQTASSIERAILGVRAEEEKLAVMARTSAEDAVRLRTEQAEDFKTLAAIRLEALLSKEVAGEIDSVERQALDLVERGRQRLSSAADRRASALEATLAAEADHAEKAAAVDALGDRIEGLAASVEASIQQDSAWKTQQERVVRAEIVAKGRSGEGWSNR